MGDAIRLVKFYRNAMMGSVPNSPGWYFYAKQAAQHVRIWREVNTLTLVK